MTLAVERETGAGNPVGIAPGDRPEMRMPVEIRCERGKAEREIGALAVAVGHLDRLDDAAIGEDRDRETGAVVEPPALDRDSFRRNTERLCRDGDIAGYATGVRLHLTSPL